LAIEEQWARHNLKPGIDVFVNWRIFIVETDTIARLIYCNMDTPDDIQECFLLPGECDNVLMNACQEIGRLYEDEENKM
jgi:hypothetical protein